jgi:hypothetical protein
LVDELRAFDAREFHVRVADGRVREISRSLSPQDSFGEDAQAFTISREHLPLVRNHIRELLATGGEQEYCGAVLLRLSNEGALHPIYTNQQVWSEFDTEDDYRQCVEMIEALAGKPTDFRSYGLHDASPAITRQDGTAPTPPRLAGSLRHVAQRLRDHISNRTLPWRLRWIPEALSGFRYHPRQTLRWLKPMVTHSLSPNGFRLQLHGREVLAAITEESRAVGIRPFLLWGTLLGCIRGDGFILNDHDIDMGLLEEEFHRVPELKRRMLARGYRVRMESAGKISFMHPRVQVWVDLDRLVETRDHFWVSGPASDEPLVYAYWFPRESLATLAPRTFEGIDVLVHQGAETILETIYGTWRIPQPERDYLHGPLNLMLWHREALLPDTGDPVQAEP